MSLRMLRTNPRSNPVMRSKDGTATKAYLKSFIGEVQRLLQEKGFHLEGKGPGYDETSMLVVKDGSEAPDPSSFARTFSVNPGNWYKGSYANAEFVFNAAGDMPQGGYVWVTKTLTGFNGPGNAHIQPDPIGDARTLVDAAYRASNGTFKTAPRPDSTHPVIFANPRGNPSTRFDQLKNTSVLAELGFDSGEAVFKGLSQARVHGMNPNATHVVLLHTRDYKWMVIIFDESTGKYVIEFSMMPKEETARLGAKFTYEAHNGHVDHKAYSKLVRYYVG